MEISPRLSRTLLHVVLLLSFLTGVVFKQFDIWYSEPFVLVAFVGALAILVDYTLKIRKQSIMWLIPAFVSIELLGILMSKAGFSQVAYYLYMPGALTFLVYGILFIRSGIVNRKLGQGVSWKFVVLGILAGSLTGWEAITYAPDDYNYFHIGWRALYLGVFAWVLLVDLTVRFRQLPSLKVEGEIIRVSNLLIAWMYFDRFIFQ